MKSFFIAGLMALTTSTLANAGHENFIQTPSGLSYMDIKVGEGSLPKKGETVIVHYTGWLQQNNKKFDSSLDRGEPFSFVLGEGQVIAGWDEGVASMKKGGKRKLIIPGNLAYGAQEIPGVIPSNATLVFEVELLNIVKPQH